MSNDLGDREHLFGGAGRFGRHSTGLQDDASFKTMKPHANPEYRWAGSEKFYV